MPETPATRVLITGAAGRIGTSFRRFAGDRYAFRLADRAVDAIAEPAGHEVIPLDVADLDACRAACTGVDVVMHLAADPSPSADFYGSLLDNNIKGAYNVFRAAADQECQRVIFASSVHAVEGYPHDRQLTPDVPVRPRNMYGVSKCFGEAVAQCFAVSEGLPSVCLRIGAYEGGPRPPAATAHLLSMFLSQRDLNALLLRCIDAPLPPPDQGAVVVHAISDNRFKRLDVTTTRHLFDFAPQDDGFRLIGLDEPEWMGTNATRRQEGART
ncbi:MAG: NAD-dependent epimerase/dehydratase family protein [Thermomicrobiales bacterium]